jgi:ribosome-binding protein aMBF1 (putative translation factor)
MKTNKSIEKSINFQHYLDEQLKKPEFKKHYDEAGKQLEISYKILQLRKQKGISQLELAKKLGTTQSNIARLEAGQQNLTTSTLQKIAKIFKRDLRIEFV